MKLLLRRDQRTGVFGKPIFTLTVRADLSPEEKANIQKYRLGETFLFQKIKDMYALQRDLKGVSGFIQSMALDAAQIELQVKDLENGRVLECKDIVEMLGIEAIIKEAASTFRAVLEAASKFGGEEVVEL